MIQSLLTRMTKLNQLMIKMMMKMKLIAELILEMLNFDYLHPPLYMNRFGPRFRHCRSSPEGAIGTVEYNEYLG